MKFEFHPIGKAYRANLESEEIAEIEIIFGKKFSDQKKTICPYYTHDHYFEMFIGDYGVAVIRMFPSDNTVVIKFSCDGKTGLTFEQFLETKFNENLKKILLFNMDLFE
jgi:hypothetical protein